MTTTNQSNFKKKILLVFLSNILFLSISLYAEASSRIVVLGSSTARGYGLSNYKNSWVVRYRTYLESIDTQNQVINLSYSGYTTYHAMPDGFSSGKRPSPDKKRNITTALSYYPDAIIINYPTNDIKYGYDIEEILANYETIVQIANKQGVPVWIATPQPANFSQATSKQKLFQLRDSVLKIYGDNALDFWSEIATETGGLKSTYRLAASDRVHLNSAGHKILFERVLEKNIHKICDVPGRNLYLTGGATNVEWDEEKGIPFVRSPYNPNIHTLECELWDNDGIYGSHFRIMCQPDINGYGLFPPKNGEVISDTPMTFVKKKSTSRESGYRWKIPKEKQGHYKITVNLSNNLLRFEFLGQTRHIPKELYLIGGATEAEWEVDKAIPFKQDSNNPAIFTLTTLLKSNSGINGNKFKILEQADYLGYSLHPPFENQSLSETNTYVQKKEPVSTDSKWTISSSKQGYYKLTVNTLTGTLSAEFLGALKVLPAKLYLVGGVTPNKSYDSSSGIPFEQDPVNPNIFRLECLLKISTVTNGDQFRILEQNKPGGYGLYAPKSKFAVPSTSSYIEKVTSSSTSSYRWLVPSNKQGYYRLTIDIKIKILTAEYLGNTLPRQMVNSYVTNASLEIEDSESGNIDIAVHGNELRLVARNIDSPFIAKVIGLDGSIISEKASNGEEISITNLPKGIFVVNIVCGGKLFSQKIIIK